MDKEISFADFIHKTGNEKVKEGIIEFIANPNPKFSVMSVRTFYPRRRHIEQGLSDVEAGKSDREEDEEKDMDCLQQLSRCPSCNQVYDIVQILPCSHTMCGHCVAAGGGTSSGQPHHRSVCPPICSVLCKCCRHPVELPCWTWSSATSCLPKHPTLSPACVNRETGTQGGASEDNLQHVRVRDPN